MIWHVCALYDRIAGTYAVPFTVPAVGVATRLIADEVRGKTDQQFVKHPEDFELWKLAVMDPESGTIVQDKPELICKVSSLLDVAE